MGRISQDLSGRVFTYLTAVERIRKNNKIYWKCVCKCGAETEVYVSKLTTGHTKSCGCYHREAAAKRLTTHGMKHTRTYKIWWRMVTRVTNPNDADYPRYSALGMAESWKNFENFYADMGEAPEGLSIDRVDNARGYLPDNCRWATNFEQSVNKSNTVKLYWRGETKSLRVWAAELGLDYGRVYQRYKVGMSADRILAVESLRVTRK